MPVAAADFPYQPKMNKPLTQETALFYDLGVPGWVGLDLGKPYLLLVGSTDATGRYVLKASNPGGIGLRLHLQAVSAAGTTPGTRKFGTSNVLTFDLDIK